MIEIAAPRPVDGVPNPPALARQGFERPPHLRLRFSAHPAAGGQVHSATARRRQGPRQHEQGERQPRVAGSGDHHGGGERDHRDGAT